MKKILLLTLLAGAARAVDRFEHGDWMSACDNTNTCRAAGFQADGLGENPVALLLTRAAGAGAPLQGEISLAAAPYGEDGPPLPASVKLLLNGRSLGPVALDENGQGELTPAQLEALIDALQAKHADIRFSGGGTQWRLSDAGAAAVLLRLDAQQGRINSPSALIKKRRGNGPVTVSPLPVPVIRAAQVAPSEPSFIPAGSADFQRISRLLDPEEECEIWENDDPRESSMTVHRLDDHFRLVSKLCNRGAYNTTFRYGLFDSALQELQQLLGDEDPLNDYEDGTISGNHKMRGLGDCWVRTSYVWTGERFMRSSVSDSGLCKGVPGGSWELPTFVSEVKESD